MAKCKRCGAIFDYDKKDGVCPKCCFYNRPPGVPDRDNEWISTYNVEENTYQLPKSIVEQEEEETRGLFHRRHSSDHRKYTSAKDCRTEGSHVHTEKKYRTSGKKESKGKKEMRSVFRIFFLLIFLLILLLCFAPLIFNEILSGFHWGEKDYSVVTGGSGFEVSTMTPEELMEGAKIGSMTFSYDGQGARVIFHEGDLPEIPKGEKCIGIHITADESSLANYRIDWTRPYVYDGSNYRAMVDGAVLTSYNLPETRDREFMHRYVTPGGDFDGEMVFFVDENAQSVILCIPDQTDGEKRTILNGVVEIELPVTETAGEGGAGDGQ